MHIPLYCLFTVSLTLIQLKMEGVNNQENINRSVFIPGCIHSVFPENRSEMIDYVAALRGNIKKALIEASGSLTLTLFVKKVHEGVTMGDKLRRMMMSTESKSCIIWFVHLPGSHMGSIANFGLILDPQFLENHDYCSINLSTKSGVTLENTTLNENRRLYVSWIVKILIASVQSPPGLSHVRFVSLNNVNPRLLWSKYIGSVDDVQVLNEARNTIRMGSYILCSRVDCDLATCRALFHLSDFTTPYLHFASDVFVNDNEEIDTPSNGSRKAIYHVATFGLGPIVIQSREFQHSAGNHVMTEAEILSGLESTLGAYRILCRHYYTYLVAGIRVSPDGPSAPDNLTLDAIKNGLKVYMYVGISYYEGIAPHNFNGCGTNFAKCISVNKLNCFWMIKNYLFDSYARAEKQEVLIQLLFRRIKLCNPELSNLICCNLRLEVSAMDWCTNDELEQVVRVLDDTTIPLICDSAEHLVHQYNYGVFREPIQMCNAQKFDDY